LAEAVRGFRPTSATSKNDFLRQVSDLSEGKWSYCYDPQGSLITGRRGISMSKLPGLALTLLAGLVTLGGCRSSNLR
jgi:hypothetical protein